MYYVISGEPCRCVEQGFICDELTWGAGCCVCRGTGRVLVPLAEALIALTAAPEPVAVGAKP